jgi:signal transduction histidine kinase
MLEKDLSGVQNLLDKIGESEDFRIVYLLDPSGRVIFAPNQEGQGSYLDNRQPDCQPCHRLPPKARPDSVVVTVDGGQRVFRSMLPIENGPECRKCHDPDQRVLGLLLTDIPTAPLEKSLASNLRENLIWWSATILVTVIIVNLVMSRLVIGRLEGVAESLAQFGKGKLDLRLQVDSPDEIGRLAQTFNEMGQNIQSEESKNRALSEDLRRHAARQRDLLKRLITAQEEERRRVAHDLHDVLGQDLSGLAVNLQRVELVTDPKDEVRAQLLKIRRQIAQMTDQTYDMILTLRPSALDDLGLLPALRAHADRVLNPVGIQFVLEAEDLVRRLPQEIETAIFRMFQEALSNVVRHAGASRVRISLASRDGFFEGEIMDDGRGFDPETVPMDGSGPRGLGLLGMQERIALCGGTLAVLSRPAAGTRIRIRIPLSEENGG